MKINNFQGDLTDVLAETKPLTAQVTGDGNCFFRTLADQLQGDSGDHAIIRRDVVSFIQNFLFIGNENKQFIG